MRENVLIVYTNEMEMLETFSSIFGTAKISGAPFFEISVCVRLISSFSLLLISIVKTKMWEQSK